MACALLSAGVLAAWLFAADNVLARGVVRSPGGLVRLLPTLGARERRQPASAVGAVVQVLRDQLLQRAPAHSEVLDRPGKVAGGGGKREQLPHEVELLAAVAVDVHASGLDLAHHLPV